LTGDPVGQLYHVVDGVVRTCRVLIDGRRQISGFYLPGETFGVASGETHDFCAEAVVDCTIRMTGRITLDGESRDSHVASQTYALMRRELKRTQDHLLLLAMNGLERVAGFLLEMAERFHSSDLVELPMSRQDIGDYLGLTIETVSRLLAQLERESAIDIVTSRRIVLRRRTALRRLASLRTP